jgi:hypothetical protein
MELVKGPGGRRKGLVRRDALSQLCDVGDRLEYVIARYTRIVREVGEDSATVPDFAGRVGLINSQLVYVAQRLQEMLLLDYETAKADSLASEGSSAARRQAFPRSMARASA